MHTDPSPNIHPSSISSKISLSSSLY